MKSVFDKKILGILPSINDFLTRKFVRDFLQTVMTKGLSMVFSVLIGVLIGRGLGPEGMGRYMTVLTIIGVGVQFGNLGLSASNVYYVAQNRRILGFLLKNSLFIGTLLGLLISGGIAVFYFIFSSQLDIPTAHVLLIMIGVPIMLNSLFVQNLMIGIEKIKYNNRIEVFTKVLLLISMSLFFLSDILTTEIALLLALFESLIWTLYLGYHLFKQSYFKGGLSMKLFNRNINYGLRTYFITLFGFLVIRSDILLIKYFLDETQLGYYSIAVQIVDKLSVIVLISASLLMPKISAIRSFKEKFRQNYRVTKYVFVLLLFLIIPLMVGAEFLIEFLFGIEFVPAATSFQLLLVAIFFLSLQTIISQFLASIGMPKVLIYYWAVTFIFNLLLNMFLIPTMGINGAALSSILSYLLILTVVIHDVKKRIKFAN